MQDECVSEQGESSTDHGPFFLVSRPVAASGEAETTQTMRIPPRLTEKSILKVIGDPSYYRYMKPHGVIHTLTRHSFVDF